MDETARCSFEAVITVEHFAAALRTARCSVSRDDLDKYKKFAKTSPHSRQVSSDSLKRKKDGDNEETKRSKRDDDDADNGDDIDNMLS